MTNIIRETLINEILINEDYPTNWDVARFASLNNFAQRKNYCDNNLLKISSGTGRIVYKIDNEKVLKLAKNQRGLGQCNAEIDLSNQEYFNHLFAKVLEYDEDGKWVEMQLATKLTTAKFQSIMGYPFGDYCIMLRNNEFNNVNIIKNYKDVYAKTRDIIIQDQFYNDICELMKNYEMSAGDLIKSNSYGIILDDGDEKVVLVDYGLTGLVYDNYYG